jgi:hypothetical protein
MPAKQAADNSREIDIKNRQLAQQASIQKQKNLLDLKNTETDRINKLRKAISTQRANFGSQGVGSVTGSADSVLQGINENSDIARQHSVSKTALDNALIDENYGAQSQLNLLQKQQLQQKTALAYLNDYFKKD